MPLHDHHSITSSRYHGRGAPYSPCLRLASRNGSRSPSSTAVVLPISTLVRRSLMRDWSSTYERIWLPQLTSDLESSSTLAAALRLFTSSSYSFAFSCFHALSRFLCWLRSFWHATTMPVGTCVRRTADSVLLTCWPPAPLER